MNCPFCELSAKDQRIIFQNESVRFIQDERHQGSLKHSGVIIPIQHRATVFDLTEQEIIATFRLLSEVKKWMDEEFQPGGYNIGWNCGEIAGQKVSHAHMHVMPRFADEPLVGKGIRWFLKSNTNKW